MHKTVTFLLALITTLSLLATAMASDPAIPADEALVASLLPGYSLVEGNITRDGSEMRLLMHRPDGALVFVGCTQDQSSQWTTFESTPLPEGTILGVENFVHSLGVPGASYYTAVSVAPFSDGRWGVSLIYPEGDAGLFQLGRNWILSDDVHAVQGAFGEHPWNDLSVIDWTALPASYDEAVSQLNTDGWAVVHNPDPEDRLHLRTKASTDAVSLGKYYNRTLVQVLERGKEWTKVAIGEVQGWMMTKYLAFGKDMQSVDFAGPWLMAASEEIRLYARADEKAFLRTQESGNLFYVVGVVGNDWFHLWLPEHDEYLYVKQDDLWEGNG